MGAEYTEHVRRDVGPHVKVSQKGYDLDFVVSSEPREKARKSAKGGDYGTSLLSFFFMP